MSIKDHPEGLADEHRREPAREAQARPGHDDDDDDDDGGVGGRTPQPDERQPFTPIVLAIAFLLALALALWGGGQRTAATVLPTAAVAPAPPVTYGGSLPAWHSPPARSH